jgi:hypothetical protein
MLKFSALCGAAFLCFALSKGYAQSADPADSRVGSFPTRLLVRIHRKVSNLNTRLTDQTESYLGRMQRQEERMRQKLATVDPAGAASLFGSSAQRYAELEQRVRTDTGGKGRGYSGIYPAYLDSLQGSMSFLKQNPAMLSNTSAGSLTQLQGANTELQTFQSRLGDADAAKAFLQQRKQQIAAYIAQHPGVSGLLGKGLSGMNQGVYYYSQQLRQYEETWTSPDALEQKALAALNKVAAFQTFMKDNSMLGGLFHLPGSYGKPQGLSGLQTKDQIGELIKGQVGGSGAGGSGGSAGGAGMAALQSNLQNAQTQVENYQSKLTSLGAGNGNMDLPDFKPNDQKTKTFWKRLEYGANFQTTHNNYYFPMVTDFGASLGYKLGHNNIVGVGASYKLGWGNGIQHIAFTNQGVGLRSFLQIGIKGSFSATGGFEYNYTTPFASFQNLKQLQDWTKSGLIGVTKTISLKNRVFKKTSVSLLWDFLSYQQVPQTQPFLFRIGYTF